MADDSLVFPPPPPLGFFLRQQTSLYKSIWKVEIWPLSTYPLPVPPPITQGRLHSACGKHGVCCPWHKTHLGSVTASRRPTSEVALLVTSSHTLQQRGPRLNRHFPSGHRPGPDLTWCRAELPPSPHTSSPSNEDPEPCCSMIKISVT